MSESTILRRSKGHIVKGGILAVIGRSKISAGISQNVNIIHRSSKEAELSGSPSHSIGLTAPLSPKTYTTRLQREIKMIRQVVKHVPAELLQEDLERYRRRALELGAADAAIIRASDVP